MSKPLINSSQSSLAEINDKEDLERRFAIAHSFYKDYLEGSGNLQRGFSKVLHARFGLDIDQDPRLSKLNQLLNPPGEIDNVIDKAQMNSSTLKIPSQYL
jgi:hypothetical protein